MFIISFTPQIKPLSLLPEIMMAPYTVYCILFIGVTFSLRNGGFIATQIDPDTENEHFT